HRLPDELPVLRRSRVVPGREPPIAVVQTHHQPRYRQPVLRGSGAGVAHDRQPRRTTEQAHRSPPGRSLRVAQRAGHERNHSTRRGETPRPVLRHRTPHHPDRLRPVRQGPPQRGRSRRKTGTDQGGRVTNGPHGSCDRRFAGVHELLTHRLANGDDTGASVCVIRDGDTVVDLWGGLADADSGREWTRDTLVNSFSLTKTMTTLVVLRLLDRGELD